MRCEEQRPTAAVPRPRRRAAGEQTSASQHPGFPYSRHCVWQTANLRATETQSFQIKVAILSKTRAQEVQALSNTLLFPREENKHLFGRWEELSSSVLLAPITPNPPSLLENPSPCYTRLSITLAPQCQVSCFAHSSSTRQPKFPAQDCCRSGRSDKKALVAVQ